MVSGALFYHLFPEAGGLFTLVLSQVWLAPLFVVGALILFRRHTTLAYGDLRNASGWLTMVGVALLMIVPFFKGVASGNEAHMGLLLSILIMDRIVSSIYVRRSTFFVFDMGVMIGLLSMIHPAFLLISIFLIIKLKQLDLATIPHVSALILGISTVWLLFVFLFAEPSLNGVSSLLGDKISPLFRPTFPHLSEIPSVVGGAVFILGNMLLFRETVRGSVSRARFLNRTHIIYGWIAWGLYLFYGFGSYDHSRSFMLISLFFVSSPALYFTDRHAGFRRSLVFSGLALMVLLTEVWPFFPILSSLLF